MLVEAEDYLPREQLRRSRPGISQSCGWRRRSHSNADAMTGTDTLHAGRSQLAALDGRFG